MLWQRYGVCLVAVGGDVIVPFLQARCKNTNISNEQHRPDRDQSESYIAFNNAFPKYANAGSAVGDT